MDIERRKKRKHKLFWNMLGSTITPIATYYYKYIHKEPCMTSKQKGKDWVKELLNGNPIRCVNAFRIEPHIFLKLCNELESKYGLTGTDEVPVFEKVGIFLYTLALGISNRDVAERFQHSGETISRVFHEVLEAICGRDKGHKECLACDVIKPRDATFQSIPSKIATDKRYMPFFKDCIGCIDGTHIAACIPEKDQLPYRGRKPIPTFNVMGVCDFDMCFTFVSAGWEGSVHDTRVFLHAINTPEMNFPKPPPGKYYLGDKGYPERDGYLVPYPKKRYHLSEFEHMPPKYSNEAFNRAHSSLRSCIERSFGVLKKRWKILSRMAQYSVGAQIDIIIASFALHNYIRMNSESDLVFNMLEQNPQYVPTDDLSDVPHHDHQNAFGDVTNHQNPSQGSMRMKEIRNSIAEMIWAAKP